MTDIMDIVRKKKQAIQASSGRRENTHKPQPGKSKFRILPGWREGDPTFFQDFGQHFVKNQKDELQAVYMCVDKTYGQPCPICQSIEQGIMRSTDDDITKALKESKSSSRVLFNALHLDGDDANTPIILDLSPTTAEKVLGLMEEYGNITDLDEGVDIIITRSGKGLNTEYTVMPAPKSAPVDKAVLKNLHNLDEYVKQEFDQGRNKAIAAVSNISGLLPPAASASAPKLSAPAESYDDNYASMPADDEPTYSEPKLEAEPVSSEASDAIGDDELDAMLAELGG